MPHVTVLLATSRKVRTVKMFLNEVLRKMLGPKPLVKWLKSG